MMLPFTQTPQNGRFRGLVRLAPVAVLAALAVCLAVLALAASRAGADTVHLSDGTTLVGEVKKIGSTYQVKTVDGQYKFIPESKVTKIDSDDGSAAPSGGGAAATPSSASGSSGAGAATGAKGYSSDYWDLQSRMERIEEPVRAVTLWQEYLKRKNLSPAEREQVEGDLKYWKELYANNAEKIKGQWMQSQELKDLKDEVDKLVEEGARLEENQSSILAAIRNYQKAIRLYPNCFPAHFRLGYLELKQSYGGPGSKIHAQRARRSLEAARRLQPDNPAVLSNYGACMAALGEPQRAIQYLWRATQKAETTLIVGNLLNVLNNLPPRFFRSSIEMQNINQQANSLRERYQAGQLLYITDPRHGLDAEGGGEDEDRGPPGLRGNGSGFFVTADGFLITNKHVAETDDGFYYRVRLADKDADDNYVEYLARFIASDDKYDIALLKVDLPEGETVPFVHLIEKDYPPVQADILTLGYPTTGTQGFNLQVSRGQVTTVDPQGDEDFDVYMDIKGTQGNSGGPVVDRNGQVIGILSAYRKVYDSIITLAVGPAQIRDFLSDVEGAPTLAYDTSVDRPFNAQQLVEEVRPKTLLVLIFRGNIDDPTDDAGDAGGAEGDDGAPEERSAPDGQRERFQAEP